MAPLARWCFHHRRIVLSAWLLALVLMGGVSHAVGSSYANNFSFPSTDSSKAQDIVKANFAAQAALYGKVTTVCLHNPNCRVLQTWGFTDKYSWIPAFFKGKQGWALPFDDSYQKKPAYDAILKALEAK